jgi:pyridoxal/pyridoxine/pyridoxamine kinase
MYIPRFALREREREILSNYLNRPVKIQLAETITAYVTDEQHFEEILEFVSRFREGQEVNESLNEAGAPSAIPNTNRAGVLRAVTAVFNVMVDAQKIKDPDLKTAAMASILSATMSIFAVSPEYGQRLISILKSKI